MFFQLLITPLLHILYPKNCLGCGHNGTYLCNGCLTQLPRNTLQYCPICTRPAMNGLTHPRCRKTYSLDGLIVMSQYSGVLKKAIKTLKYRSVKELALPLAQQLTAYVVPFLPQTNMITYVPLSKKKMRLRGFNQSELLATQLHTQLTIPIEPTLEKIHDTANQADSTVAERKTNVKGVFRATKNLNQACILLVDDVCTTGSTLSECTKILKKAGASKVYALVLARGH